MKQGTGVGLVRLAPKPPLRQAGVAAAASALRLSSIRKASAMPEIANAPLGAATNKPMSAAPMI